VKTVKNITNTYNGQSLGIKVESSAHKADWIHILQKCLHEAGRLVGLLENNLAILDRILDEQVKKNPLSPLQSLIKFPVCYLIFQYHLSPSNYLNISHSQFAIRLEYIPKVLRELI